MRPSQRGGRITQGFEFDGEKYKAASKHQKEWGSRAIESLDLTGSETILDLGCGDGALTKLLADRVPNGRVLGIDRSGSMIAEAKKLERENLNFKVMDINEIDLNEEFDIIFSNAALHWVKDHRSLLKNVHQALRPGGRVRFNFAGDGNCSNFFTVVRGTISLPKFAPYFEKMDWPWFMPPLDEYCRLISQFPFTDMKIRMENADRKFTEDELVRWIDQPSIVPLLARVEENDKKAFRDSVVEQMKVRTKREDGGYFETFRRIDLDMKKIKDRG